MHIRSYISNSFTSNIKIKHQRKSNIDYKNSTQFFHLKLTSILSLSDISAVNYKLLQNANQ